MTADRIVAYFYLKQSHYLLGMPERAQYAKLFRFVQTHQNVDVGHRLAELAAYLKIDASQLVLMLKIFTELHFATIAKGVLNPVAQPTSQKNRDGTELSIPSNTD
ncbi:single-stranded-DNA-specific exonuclease C-terminal domain-containing protein [Secundilactobacillus collinoides]|uniref:single-stranded-DNA-specific exonuclease C-terminal domain-containing protein n=1 Tax=Secundilactobacillus collinoides TaxID=33960 RepID=UPI000AFAC9DB